MRFYRVIALLAAFPAGLSAQRIPIPIITRGPARPAELPRQPAPIVRELAYRRLRLSVETYPLISYFEAPVFAGDHVLSSWTSFGMGTHFDYRVARYASATLDMTSTFLGGPAITETAEIGTRLGPQRQLVERKWYPFVDARGGYIAAYSRALGPIDNGFGEFSTGFYGARYSRGLGVIGGGGVEYALTRSWFITTSAYAMRSAMSARDPALDPSVDHNFGLTAYRYTLGIKYNPVRYYPAPDTR